MFVIYSLKLRQHNAIYPVCQIVKATELIDRISFTAHTINDQITDHYIYATTFVYKR